MMNEDSDFEEIAPWLVILITVMGGCLRVILLANQRDVVG